MTARLGEACLPSGQNADFTYNATTFFGAGKVGCATDTVNTCFGDYDGDGDVDSTDDASLGSGQTCWGTPTGACRVFDFNSDGTLDSSDETVMTALVGAASTNRRHENKKVSAIGMGFLHQGASIDGATDRYYFKQRSMIIRLQRVIENSEQFGRVKSYRAEFTPSRRQQKPLLEGEDDPCPSGNCQQPKPCRERCQDTGNCYENEEDDELARFLCINDARGYNDIFGQLGFCQYCLRRDGKWWIRQCECRSQNSCPIEGWSCQMNIQRDDNGILSGCRCKCGIPVLE